MFRRVLHSVSVIAALVAAMSFTLPKHTKLTIRFENYVGDIPVKLDTLCYKNSLGQLYSVSMFKYYAGDFHLKNLQGQEFVSTGYFLINEDDKSSLQITIDSIPKGEYTAISFTLGVDSIDNCSGAQSGALDPINGMFWAWNSGYIFLKMEGISPASNSTGKRLEFHIGGYKEPNNCTKTIHLKLNHTLKIGEETNNVVKIKADVSHLFAAPTPVDFSKLSSVTDFHNAKAIADNYCTMFGIIEN
jgi:hypothetical protein